MNITKNMQAIILKIFATLVLFALGHTVFTSVPLWAGMVFVIPGFSLYLLFWFKSINKCFSTNEIKASWNNNFQKHETKHNFQSVLHKDYKRGYSSLTDRKNKYGY